MLLVDRPPHLGAELDGEELISEEGMSFVGYTSLEDSKGIFQLSYSLAHLGYLSMQLVGIREDESAKAKNGESEIWRAADQVGTPRRTDLVPWPAERLPALERRIKRCRLSKWRERTGGRTVGTYRRASSADT